jgi:hypothetical protein
MKKLLKIRTSIAIFFLFFATALLETFRTHNWINAAFWIGIAIMFLIVDNVRPGKLRSQFFNNNK